ncbi:SDR family NAD(P)-dependent oxidoreductase [uncultured Amnibacterium sp.]|uniref:SDR family NAD(P)-dependent oxidoreductase n=1 Tax=uncultured Amnibacterium sp. TaxID=1631851 RepID=UPI0035C9CF87
MDRRVVVTGASRGLGRALVEAYARAGAAVWAGCRRPDDVARLQDLGIEVRYLDVCDEESIARLAEEVGAAGGADLLVNAAGTDARAFGAAADHRGPFELSASNFLAEVEVNAIGPMLTTRLFRDQLEIAAAPAADSSPFDVSQARYTSPVRSVHARTVSRRTAVDIYLPCRTLLSWSAQSASGS